MPTPTLPLPWRPHQLAYEWLARRLRKDPTLRRTVKTWVTRVPGGPTDDDPPADALCPWIRLTPTPGPSRVAGKLGDRIVRLAPVLVRVETCTSGFGPADSFNLADTVWAAIFADHFAAGEIAARTAAYIQSIDEETAPAAGAVPGPGPGAGLLYAAGQLRLNVRA